MKEIYWRAVEGIAWAAKFIAAAMAILAAVGICALAGVAVAVTMFGDVKLP